MNIFLKTIVHHLKSRRTKIHLELYTDLKNRQNNSHLIHMWSQMLHGVPLNYYRVKYYCFLYISLTITLDCIPMHIFFFILIIDLSQSIIVTHYIERRWLLQPYWLLSNALPNTVVWWQYNINVVFDRCIFTYFYIL